MKYTIYTKSINSMLYTKNLTQTHEEAPGSGPRCISTFVFIWPEIRLCAVKTSTAVIYDKYERFIFNKNNPGALEFNLKKI